MVTDSTAYLPADIAASRDIVVVPLEVIIDRRAYVEGVEIGPGEVAEALERGDAVSTSRPSPRRLLDAYESAAAMGASVVISVHLSGALSGTVDAARLAAQDAPVPVHVVDSRSLAMGLGFAALTAADARDRGLFVDEIVDITTRRAAGADVLFYVDTLEHLRRGGRIGAASAMVGTAFAIKPLLELRDGSVTALDKVRTTSRALARLGDIACSRAAERPVDVAVHHLANPKRARGVADSLSERLPSAGDIPVMEVGAVIGAHAGPGVVGVVISPR